MTTQLSEAEIQYWTMKVIKHLDNSGGDSYVAKDVDFDHQEYVVKKMHSKLTSEQTNRILTVASTLNQITHPCLASFGGVWIPTNEGKRGAIVQHYYTETITSKYSASQEEKMSLCAGIALGMKFLHSNGIIVGNLTPSSIFVCDEFPKIGDFGLSRLFGEELDFRYSSPQIQDRTCDKMDDVFSFGIIVNEIFSGESPFAQSEEEYQRQKMKIASSIRHEERPKVNSNIPSDIQNLVLQCWNSNPNERPTFDEIVSIFRNHRECFDIFRQVEIFEYPEKAYHELVVELWDKNEENHQFGCNFHEEPNMTVDFFQAFDGKISPALFSLFLRNGADINAKDECGRTPLMFSLDNEQPDLARFLIEEGADINAKDNREWTPLMYSLENKLPDIARLLIEKGADINTKDDSDWTPLMFSLFYKQPDIARFLIEKGADINAKDFDGNTAFTYANKYCKEIVPLLPKQGLFS